MGKVGGLITRRSFVTLDVDFIAGSFLARILSAFPLVWALEFTYTLLHGRLALVVILLLYGNNG